MLTMKIRNLLWAILFLAVTSTYTTAQNREPFSLNDAIAYAQSKSNNVRDAQLDIARAKAEVQEYTAIGIPKLNGEVSYNYYIDIPTQLIPNAAFGVPGEGFIEAQFGTRNNLNLGLTLSTLVFDGSYFVGLKASRGFLEMTKRQAELTKYDLKNVIAKAYLTVLIAEENKKVLLRNIENINVMLKETKAFFENGLVEQLDVDRLQLSLSNLKVEQEALERQVELAYNVLKFQMNYPLKDSIELVDDLEGLLALPEPNDLNGEVAFEQRKEVGILDQSILLNKLNIKRFAMGYLPRLSAFATHQQNLQRNDLFDEDAPGFFPTTIVGLQLDVPIFDGFDKAAKIKKSKIDVQKLNIQLETLKRSIELEVVNNRAIYKNAQVRLSNQDENLALAERIMETTRIKYREGVGSSLEMVQAEQELYRTQANRLNALYDLVVAKIDLDKALGK